ncbi:metalloregulator ArsR/SmtB family transcription factor [Paenibacillus sp. GP183]|uniref:helix-turn-helix transcriptional regulator n=1 Tax=Paenibacillus sp. GP183 TaxID=1882751 RepID=UPI0008987CCC|nr:metalloregulator ArsR/SmtB family transcription factor [Paenibacillus sp. GP183]SEB79185.1 transcriptional regulator [Paenibacillus sp. GP183]
MNQENETSTRKVILTMLKTQGQLSVGEMSNQLRITEMAVRRHLNTLERDGLLETKLVRQAMGRPTHLYLLTKQADDLFPKNYHHLTLDLLEELLEDEGEEKIDNLFKKREDKLVAKYQSRMQAKSLGERVSELARIQNENGYMAKWNQHGDGEFELSEHNCPITQVANRYQQACQCELSLFQRLLGVKVERTECLAKGGAKCTYMIERNATNL